MHAFRRTALGLSTLFAGVLAAAALGSCRTPGSAAHRRARRASARHPSAVKANEICYECHIDFKGEELVATHENAAVACVRCHGRSQAHMEDEVRATPPDAIFRGKAVRIFCLTCHDPARHRKVPAHAAEAAKAEPAKRRSCTGCHGEHKLEPLPARKTG